MGVIINIDEALKLRTDYNVLGEPLNAMIKNKQEAWERENPIDMIYNRSSIDKFQETYTSSIGFDKAFVETNDYAIGPIFNTAEGFSATYRTRTFQGSFIITQQTLEDRQYGTAKDTANSFVKRWHGDIVEYGEFLKFGSPKAKKDNLKQQILYHLMIVRKNMELMSVIKPKSIELMKMNISTGDKLINLLIDSEGKMNVSELVIGEGCGNELGIVLKI